MDAADARRRDDALDWVCRIQDRHFCEWAAHIDWLETDPRNADAFDEMSALIDAAVVGLGPAGQAIAIRADNDDPLPAIAPSRVRRRTALGVAVAAGIAAVAAVPMLLGRGGDTVSSVRTSAGERRTIALPDGTRIALNGDSAIRLDRAAPRTVALDRGEAYFTVAHDAAHPFVVTVEGTVFQDAGTAFDLVHDGGITRAAVREGGIRYDPDGAAVLLGEGDAIEVAAHGATVRRVDADTVGGWRSGRLSYADTPMADVAADLSRSIGTPVRVDPDAATVRFTGVIMIDPDRSRMFRRVAAITGTQVRRDGAGWRMALAAR